jgi:uncharacterized protein YoxC
MIIEALSFILFVVSLSFCLQSWKMNIEKIEKRIEKQYDSIKP